jgi:hypothetical protein
VSRGRATGVTALVAGCLCAAAPVAVAQAVETSASIRPSFSPDRLDASTAVTFAFRFSGESESGSGGGEGASGEEGIPPPLSGIVVRLPAGLGIDARGVGICAKARLQSKGPSGCPSSSLIGRGHAMLEVHAGSLAVPEEATLSAFRGPDRGGRPTLEVFGQGETPLYQSAISTGVLGADSAPYGSKLEISIPPIPTLVFEPNASIVSASLTVGRAGRGPRAHASGAIFVPRSCPAGGFPFAASFTFADGTTTSASAAVPCP